MFVLFVHICPNCLLVGRKHSTQATTLIKIVKNKIRLSCQLDKQTRMELIRYHLPTSTDIKVMRNDDKIAIFVMVGLILLKINCYDNITTPSNDDKCDTAPKH
mgnify:FL=1